MVGIILEIIKYSIVVCAAFVSVMFFIGGIGIISSDSASYKNYNKIMGNMLSALKGTVQTKRDGARIYKIHTGLAYDIKNKKVVTQGSLSNESIESILR